MTGVEQVLYINKLENLKYYRDVFSRLYFGQEFCERLIPSRSQLSEALSFADSKGLSFSLVTPYVTNPGLERIDVLMDVLYKSNPEAEVVFNDWGVFHLMKEKFPSFVPVLGRLLNKIKRGPRVMNILNKMPEPARKYFRGSSLDVPATVNFLKRNNICRVEFDNILQGTDFEVVPEYIARSLYMPFVFVSTTRFCLSAGSGNSGVEDYMGVYPCKKECRRQGFILDNPVMGRSLFRKGNTIFFLNEQIPDSVYDGGVDRVVVEPEIPI